MTLHFAPDLEAECEHSDLEAGVCVDCGYDTAEDGPSDDDWISLHYERQATQQRPLTRSELIMLAVTD